MADGGLWRARAEVLGAALLFSTGGVLIKATDYSAWQVAGLRSVLALPMLWWLVPARARRLHPTAWAVGAAYAAMMVLFVASNKLTTAANAIFLQSTSPLYILLLGPWLLGERLRWRQLPVLALLAAGVVCFAWSEAAPSAVATDPWLGNGVALLSGVAWAATVMGLRALTREGPGGAAWGAVLGNGLAAGVGLGLAWPLALGGPTDWVVVAALGTLQVGGAYVLLTRGIARVPAFEASLLLMLEPAVAPVWSWWAYGELPGPWGLAGAGLVVLGLLGHAWAARGTDQ